MVQSPEQALRGLTDALSVLAQSLYEAENTPDLVFVKAQAQAGGPKAAAATRVVDLLAGLWEDYPLAKDVVDRLGTAVAGGDRDEVTRLLGGDAVTLPDGKTMFVGALIDDLRARSEVVVDEAARLAGAARTALARLDRVATVLQGLTERATRVGRADDVELVAAATALRTATSAVAADPTDDAPFAALDRALEAAGRRVEELERVRDQLPGALAAARTDLDELRRLVALGASAAVVAQAKIADTTGLLDPIDAAGLDGPADGPALAPWLTRIEAQAGSGLGQAAAKELERWRRTADRLLADARLVATTNGAPVARRNEMRGLLQAFRAKSLGRGRAEDPDLVARHAAAEQALHVAPCDLARAEALVADYVRAVNAGVSEGRR